ncbi:MAG: beta-propeller domain-containing protein [Acidimicrobiales bacterium]|nr:beta-propeller domain-containing protein [Acidimicrobiales bacterium]
MTRWRNYWRIRSAILGLFLVVTLVTSACAKDPEEHGLPGGRTTTTGAVDVSDTELTAGLVAFTACEELLLHLQVEAVERVGPYGLSGNWYGGPVMLEATAVAEDSIATSGPIARTSNERLVEGQDYSGTNVQELGIDEPDLLKTDGQRILVIEDDRLHHVSLIEGEATLTDTLRIEGHWSRQMLLTGNRVLLVADTYLDGDPLFPPAFSSLIPTGGWRELTSLIEVDLSDPTDLRIANVLTVEGHHVSTRVVGGSARVVITTPPDELPFVYPQNSNGEERARRFNREVVTETTLADWMPGFVLESADGSVVDGLLHTCADVSRPTTFAGFSTLSVLTVPLTESLSQPSTTAVLADGSTVYAGNEHLYVSTNAWVDPDVLADDQRRSWWDRNWDTAIHQFDVTDPSQTAYTASGQVPGHLLNQFSMSEHDGYLRVASTTGGPWRFDDDAESIVSVLTRRDAELEVVGQVGDMGRGERIFAVRYTGDVAYVVTFRQTDPFYTVDLSDPTAPRVRGELKITGYSGYLHPVRSDRILGIGQEATGEGRATGTKVTLFDVSDLDAPVELATWSPGGGHSGAEWDHHAFLWWNDRAVLPFDDWQADDHGAVVLRVSDTGITEEGRINHRDAEKIEPVPPCPVVSRPDGDASVVMVCDLDAPTLMSGHWCEPMPRQDTKWWPEEFGFDPETLPVDSDLVVCWPDGGYIQPIQRTLVIGDGLWSYSRHRIQENALDGLASRQVIRLR